MLSLAAGFALLAFADSQGWSAGEPPDDKERGAVNEWLARVLQNNPIKIEPKVIKIEDENLDNIFASSRFFAVYFPRWPVAIRLPKDLSYETLVCIRDGEVKEQMTNDISLKAFLAQQLSNVYDEGRARTALLASLRLAEAGAKGGPYQFEPPQVAIERQGKNILATGRSAALEPGRGQIEISIEFDSDGLTNVDGIKITDRLRAGPPGS